MPFLSQVHFFSTLGQNPKPRLPWTVSRLPLPPPPPHPTLMPSNSTSSSTSMTCSPISMTKPTPYTRPSTISPPPRSSSSMRSPPSSTAPGAETSATAPTWDTSPDPSLVASMPPSTESTPAILERARSSDSGGLTRRRLGNTIEIVGLIFSNLESRINAATGSNGVLNTVVARLGTGAIFRAMKGLRSTAITGAIGGLTVGVAVIGKHIVKRYMFI